MEGAMNLEDILSISRIEAYINKQVGSTPHRSVPSKAVVPSSRVGIRATGMPGRIVVRSGSMSFWQMRGYRLVSSSLPGVRTWRGPLITRYGQVIADIESAHRGQYTIYIINLPTHLHGHPCLPKSGRRWQMHVHGALRGLDHVIFAAERELEQHWNWRVAAS
jgi:hypothetical protein